MKNSFELLFIDNWQDSSDVVLYSEFDSKDSLMEYQVHPDHFKIKDWLKDVRYERRVVDYELQISN